MIRTTHKHITRDQDHPEVNQSINLCSLLTLIGQSLQVMEDIGEGGQLLLVLEQLRQVLHRVLLAISGHTGH